MMRNKTFTFTPVNLSSRRHTWAHFRQVSDFNLQTEVVPHRPDADVVDDVPTMLRRRRSSRVVSPPPSPPVPPAHEETLDAVIARAAARQARAAQEATRAEAERDVLLKRSGEAGRAEASEAEARRAGHVKMCIDLIAQVRVLERVRDGAKVRIDGGEEEEVLATVIGRRVLGEGGEEQVRFGGGAGGGRGRRGEEEARARGESTRVPRTKIGGGEAGDEVKEGEGEERGVRFYEESVEREEVESSSLEEDFEGDDAATEDDDENDGAERRGDEFHAAERGLAKAHLALGRSFRSAGDNDREVKDILDASTR